MKYNQYSYLSVDQKDILKELKEIGFDLPLHLTEKELFEWFVRKVYFTYKNTDYPLSNLVADAETDLLSYSNLTANGLQIFSTQWPSNYSVSTILLTLKIRTAS